MSNFRSLDNDLPFESLSIIYCRQNESLQHKCLNLSLDYCSWPLAKCDLLLNQLTANSLVNQSCGILESETLGSKINCKYELKYNSILSHINQNNEHYTLSTSIIVLTRCNMHFNFILQIHLTPCQIWSLTTKITRKLNLTSCLIWPLGK